jgi:hypothetical protein
MTDGSLLSTVATGREIRANERVGHERTERKERPDPGSEPCYQRARSGRR